MRLYFLVLVLVFLRVRANLFQYESCPFFSLSTSSCLMEAPLSICHPNKNLVIIINSSYSSNPPALCLPPAINPMSYSFVLTNTSCFSPSLSLPFYPHSSALPEPLSHSVKHSDLPTGCLIWGVSLKSKVHWARWSSNITINTFNEHSFATRSNSLGGNISKPGMVPRSLHSTSPTPKIILSKKSCYASFTVRKWQSWTTSTEG